MALAGKKKGRKDDESEDAEAAEGDEESTDGPAEEPSARAGYIGLGLVGSLVVGFDPLRDAFQGNGSFENAILRFLACAAVCVIGASTIGRLIDAGGTTVAVDRSGGRLPSGHGADIGGSESGHGAADDSALDKSEDGKTISAGPASSDQTGRQGSESQL